MATTKKTPTKKTEKAEKPAVEKVEKTEKSPAKKAAPRAAKKATPAKAEEAVVAAVAPKAAEVSSESLITTVAAPVYEFDAAAAKQLKSGEYVYAVGRRKTATAVTKLYTGGKGVITVNKKPFDTYFTTFANRSAVTAPLKAVGMDNAVTIDIVAKGGGLTGQSDAARHGIARALIELNPSYRLALKKLGFLTRDPRKKERKKFGFRGARRAPQWAKR